MSAEKYAQFIAEQQKKLSVSGTNPVNLSESHATTSVQTDSVRDSMKDAASHGLRAKRIHDDEISVTGPKEHIKKYLARHYGGAKNIEKGVHPEIYEQSEITEKKGDWNKEIAKAEKTAKEKLTPAAKAARDAAHSKVEENKELSDKQKDIAKLAGDKDDTDDDDKDDDKPAFFKKKMKEEVEQIDEKDSTDVEMNKKMGMTPIYKPSKISGPKNSGGYKSNTMKALKPKYEEVEPDDLIDEDTIALAEAMRKGELGFRAKFHRDSAKYHEKMSGKHAVLADKAEEMQDEHGFDHHYGESIHHEMEASRHHNLADRADALRDKVKARKDSKDASERLSKANAVRRDIGY